MEGLLSFLLFGGLFFLMMRFGCGSHVGHGGHSGHGDDQAKDTDPVCGMDVEVNQGYGKMHKGHLYRFCSRTCLDRFDADPEKYVNQPADDAGGRS